MWTDDSRNSISMICICIYTQTFNWLHFSQSAKTLMKYSSSFWACFELPPYMVDDHQVWFVKSMRGFIKSVVSQSVSLSQYHIFTLKVNRSVSQPVCLLVVWFILHLYFLVQLDLVSLFFSEKSEKTGLLKSLLAIFWSFLSLFFPKFGLVFLPPTLDQV